MLSRYLSQYHAITLSITVSCYHAICRGGQAPIELEPVHGPRQDAQGLRDRVPLNRQVMGQGQVVRVVVRGVGRVRVLAAEEGGAELLPPVPGGGGIAGVVYQYYY